MISRIVCAFIMLLMVGCHPSSNSRKDKRRETISDKGFDFKDSIRYAKGFTIEVKNGRKYIKVYNPWNNDEVMRRYLLIPRGEKEPKNMEEGVTVVHVPVKTVALFSNTHVGPLAKLGLEDRVVGMTRSGKVYNHKLYSRVESGEVANLGGAHNKNLDVEKIVELNPELIFLSAFSEVKTGESRLEQVGFKLAYALNWMEATPLGRAEWFKFVAAFFNKGPQADSLFNIIEHNYNSLKKVARNVKVKPTVLLGWSYRGTWYMPGGQNYLVSYLRDAGADYFYYDDNSRGNIPMSAEVVLDQCINADMWIYPGTCHSMNDIANGGELFTKFKAYQKGEVYNIYKRSNPNGGSDWWESGCVNPDVVLKDFIKILHPQLLPQDSTVYLSKLKFNEPNNQ